jgi:hypothetical protein
LLIESNVPASQLQANMAGVRPVYYRGLLDASATIDRFVKVKGVIAVSVAEQLPPVDQPSAEQIVYDPAEPTQPQAPSPQNRATTN